MSKKISWLGVILIIIVVLLGAWVGALMLGPSLSGGATGASPYAAVYVSTGDIYYGKLSWFPSPHLTDVWYLQKGGANGAQFGITPFTSSFWGPIDEVYLNPSQIIFWTYLRNNSEIAQALSNPVLLQQLLSGSGAAATVPPPAQQSTSSFVGPTTPPPTTSNK